MAKVDSITVEVVRNRLGEIVSIMEILLFHSGYSTILRESYDGSAAILNREGKLVIGHGLPAHLGPYQHAALGVIGRYGYEGMREGDSFLTNNPAVQGLHVPDFTIVTPVFYEGEVVAFCASIAHKTDIGGLVPGSSGAGAREIYHEGVLFPPVRFWTKEGSNTEVEDIIRANSRVAEVVLGDIRAQVGCTRIGARRFREVADEHGIETVMHSLDEILSVTELRVRNALREWPDGESEAEVFMAGDGITADVAPRIHVRVTKQSDEITLDFSETDPEAKGPVNIRVPLLESGTILAFLGLLDPAIPFNGGLQRAVKIVTKEGSLVSSSYTAPVNIYYNTTMIVYNCVTKALAHFCPQRAVAAIGLGFGLTFGHQRTRLSEKLGVQYELIVTSVGGTAQHDGENLIMGMSHYCPHTSVEIIETEFPVRVNTFGLNKDSAGAGKYRGGVAALKEYTVLDDCMFTVRGVEMKGGAAGVLGGEPSKLNVVTVNPGLESEVKIPLLTSMPLKAGDVVRLETAGGGGYGNPMERDPELVLEDVLNSYVSIGGAKNDYGVVIDSPTMTADLERTSRLRATQGQKGPRQA
jgi:N-methylhydantoinase B